MFDGFVDETESLEIANWCILQKFLVDAWERVEGVATTMGQVTVCNTAVEARWVWVLVECQLQREEVYRGRTSRSRGSRLRLVILRGRRRRSPQSSWPRLGPW